ncbi:MAG TPA: PHB depolymerase family esterase [Thermodesulfobacteriota bacterium]|nr:PHB depolymerase family esterase [Thermodesulfobacteriota bacterium]
MLKLKSLKILLLVIAAGLVLIIGFFNKDRATDLSTIKRDYSGSLEFGDLMRTYHVHLPPSYDGKKSAPFLLVFHGAGGNSKDMKFFDAIADREGFIVVYPDGYKRTWADGSGVTAAELAGVDDLGFVSALIDKLADELKIDPSRIYATGFSNGGMLVQRFGCELSDKIAAIASVGGTMVEKISSRCNPMRPVPVMIIHGTEDSIVPWEGGEVKIVGISGWRILSVSGTFKKWIDINGCSFPRVSNDLSGADEGTLLLQNVYDKCKNNTEVVLYALKGGGHTWPTRIQLLESLSDKTRLYINAGEVIWTFFEKHPKK